MQGTVCKAILVHTALFVRDESMGEPTEWLPRGYSAVG